jgi:hypothetical protein
LQRFELRLTAAAQDAVVPDFHVAVREVAPQQSRSISGRFRFNSTARISVPKTIFTTCQKKQPLSGSLGCKQVLGGMFPVPAENK